MQAHSKRLAGRTISAARPVRGHAVQAEELEARPITSRKIKQPAAIVSRVGMAEQFRTAQGVGHDAMRAPRIKLRRRNIRDNVILLNKFRLAAPQ